MRYGSDKPEVVKASNKDAWELIRVIGEKQALLKDDPEMVRLLTTFGRIVTAHRSNNAELLSLQDPSRAITEEQRNYSAGMQKAVDGINHDISSFVGPKSARGR